MGTTVLLNLVGGIALLLWGLHMVQSGILRAFGADLRRVLGIALRNRFAALLAGIGATALLQSSTATALMTATFVGDGLVGLVPALASMLGANVGTTLIVQVFSFDVSLVAPVLLAVGVIVFQKQRTDRIRDLGRVAIGLGLMLLSLHILLDTLAPAESAPNVRAAAGRDHRYADPECCLRRGARLGGAFERCCCAAGDFTCLFEFHYADRGFRARARRKSRKRDQSAGRGRQSQNPVARRLPLGNLINRVVGCALVLPFLQPAVDFMSLFDTNPVRLIADFHTLVQPGLAAIFIVPLPAVRQVAAMAIAASRPPASDPSAPIYLDVCGDRRRRRWR